MKNRILKALRDFRQIDELDFTQEYEGDIFSTSASKFEIESEEGFTIEFEVVETVRWEDHEWNRFEDAELEYFEVWDINGDDVNTDDISVIEILNALSL